jgi:hypothetical protein
MCSMYTYTARKVKGTVVPVYAIKVYGGAVLELHILNRGARRMQVVSFMPRPHYP